MRTPVLILLLLALCAGVAQAQEQESKLTERLLNWNMSMDSWMQNKSYNAGGPGMDTSRAANVKTFDITQSFSAKTFETKNFESKGYWEGDFQFATKSANVKADSEADKVFATKAATVKDARENGKVYDTKGYETRDAIEKGKTSQAHLNEVFLGKARMNMDEVRDLLNKDHRINPTEISSPQ